MSAEEYRIPVFPFLALHGKMFVRFFSGSVSHSLRLFLRFYLSSTKLMKIDIGLIGS